MSKFGVLLLVVVLIGLIVVPVAGQDVTEITFMRFFGDCTDDFGENTDLGEAFGECGIVHTLANAFNDSQDAIQVNTVVVDWPGVTELNANLAAGTPPDIMVLHGNRIPNYASRGLLTPLGDVLESAGIDADDLTESARGFVEWNDEIYGIPLDLHGHLWHINLDLWEQAGLLNDDGSPNLPAGSEEFLAAAEQFQEATGLPFVGMWSDGLSRNWMSMVYQQGGSIEDEEGLPVINSEEGINALNMIVDLYENEYSTPDTDYVAAEEIFLNCESGGHVNGTWVVNFYDEQVADPEGCLENYYVANFPQFFDAPAAWANSHAWIIPQGVNADPARLDATLAFLKYLNDNNIEWARTGHTSVNQSVVDSDAYQELPHRDEYSEFVPSAVIQPRTNWNTAFESVMDEELQAVVIGEKSVEQALGDAQARLEDFAFFGQ